MEYMDGAPLKVFASVSLNTLKIEQVLLDSVSTLAKSSDRLCVVLENSVAKYERPVNVLITSLACGIILVSTAYFIQTVGNVYTLYRRND